ncbi:hypothetical protein A7D17_13935 [Xanthomonas floridensis]|uniref:P/Homo B domain-containing protein n=1 Tax=Xanthomonas floridensis TaxID=1843580 RepID=A0A1A9MCV3_9XANT|nr:hypothetical protein A7D17_13935 [Xanthomonas floridensis]
MPWNAFLDESAAGRWTLEADDILASNGEKKEEFEMCMSLRAPINSVLTVGRCSSQLIANVFPLQCY